MVNPKSRIPRRGRTARGGAGRRDGEQRREGAYPHRVGGLDPERIVRRGLEPRHRHAGARHDVRRRGRRDGLGVDLSDGEGLSTLDRVLGDQGAVVLRCSPRDGDRGRGGRGDAFE